MKKHYRILFATLLLVILTLTACTGGSGNGTESGTRPPAGSTLGAGEGETTPETSADGVGLVFKLAENKNTSFKIVNGATLVDDNFAIRSFASDISKTTGASFEVIDANSPIEEYEIIFGHVSTRAEAREYYATLSYTEYGVKVVGKKIVVGYYSSEHLKTCIKVLEQELYKDENGAWGFEELLDYRKSLSKVTIPTVQTNATLQGVYPSGDGSYHVSFSGAKPTDFDAYRNTLESNGYTLYQSTEMGSSKFATYHKDGNSVQVVSYPAKSTLKVTYGKTGDLPSLTPESTTAIVTPKLTQIAREGAELSYPDGAPGMSYIYQLPDGRYIIIDGGPGNLADQGALLKYLEDNNPVSGKPVIAAWFITHAHGDHMQLAYEFLRDYKDRVVLEAVAYNLPDFKNITITNESASGLGNLASNFQSVVKRSYPEAKTYILRSGQIFYIGAAKVEVLFTHEDFYPQKLNWGNETSSAFRITLGNKSAMFLGDSEVSNCQYMAAVYGSYLKSDILQLTHHGFNGGDLGLYQNIDPDICLWAVEATRFNEDPRCLGESGCGFNAWLRNNEIKQREHYHCSVTTEIPLG